jgi:hypothetical protein
MSDSRRQALVEVPGPRRVGDTGVREVPVVSAWTEAESTRMFSVWDPQAGVDLWSFPVSAWVGVDRALQAGRQADGASKPIYLEISNVNPVVVLPDAWAERGVQLAEELAASVLAAGGQLCTNRAAGCGGNSGDDHSGPFPSGGHLYRRAVGIPGSLRRIAMLQSYDSVSDARPPMELQAADPLRLPRCVDGYWTTEPVPG